MGDWRAAHAQRVGWEHWNPLYTAKFFTAHPIAPIPGKTFLPDQESFVRVNAANVVITTIQEHPDRPGQWLVRLFETQGRQTPVEVRLPRTVRAAWAANLLGDVGAALPVAGNTVTLSLGAYAIETFVVEFAQ
jgi:alpha-mannosidase